MKKKYKCDCDFCKDYQKEMEKTIKTCGCLCHEDEDICGHSSLCCPYPNGKIKFYDKRNKRKP